MQHLNIKKIHQITYPVFFVWRNSQLADREYLNWDVQGVNHCMGPFHVIIPFVRSHCASGIKLYTEMDRLNKIRI